MNIATQRYVIGLLRSQPLLLSRFVVTSVGRTALVMASVLLIREFLFATLQKGQGFTALVAERCGAEVALWAIGVLLICSYVGASLLYYDNQVVRQRIVKAVELPLTERLVRHLLGLSVRFFDRSSHGDLIHAIRQDVANLRVTVVSCATVLTEGAVAVGLLGCAVWLSPTLAFWALLVVPAAFLPMVVIARRTRSRSFAERQTGYVVFDAILQMLRGIRIIKAYQAEEPEARATVDKARRFFDEQIRIVRIRELATVVFESLAALSIAAVIIVGGVLVRNGVLDWPQLLAFLIAVRSLHGPLNHINVDLMEIQRHRAAVDRIGQLLAELPEVRDVADAVPLRSPVGCVSVDHVSFTYGERPVLEQLSFEVRSGETIGIAGPSGSGKTTLLSLVARFYDPTSGAVRFDGRDLREVRLQDVYRQLAIVTQEPFLFAASVRENIRCGRPDASDRDVEAAAHVAEIHEEILALPDGYDTTLGVGGRILSGGQGQRINVARAILKNAPVLLLDEATSSLDSIAEAKVQRAIDKLMAGRTSLIVAHRLSTLRHADRILVLDRGQCVGLGPHDALLRDCRLYRRLWETQLQGEPEPRVTPASPAPTAPADAGERLVLSDEDLVA